MGRFDFGGVFDEDYLYFYADRLSDERSDTEAQVIASLVDVGASSRILDAPCGHGRIANRLAERGATVVGLDDNELFLDIARRDAQARGVKVGYVRGDLRELSWDAEFDVVVNWFTSFGYFGDDADRAVLADFRRALRPGGRLLLETVNRDRIVGMRHALDSPDMFHMVEVGDDLLIDRIEWDPTASRTDTERIVVRDGMVRRTRFSVRLFTVTELTAWLQTAGFHTVDALDQEGQPFTPTSSRLLIIATA